MTHSDGVPREWVGERDGWSGSVVVRRNYHLVITGVGRYGAISGWAELSPSHATGGGLPKATCPGVPPWAMSAGTSPEDGNDSPVMYDEDTRQTSVS